MSLEKWLLRTLVFLAAASLFADAQLAAIFSNVTKSSDCHLWSSWGPCIWTQPTRSRGRVSASENLYLSQLHPHCKNHWFYKFISERYGTALNNVFNYLKAVTRERLPCGMCSYRQSCGYGGQKRCHNAPTSRSLLPVYVSEELCSSRDQGTACTMDYAVLSRNGGTCQIWPSSIPVLTGLDDNIKRILYKTKWGNCVPSRDRRGRPICRCCCWPFRPNPRTFRCEHIRGAPPQAG